MKNVLCMREYVNKEMTLFMKSRKPQWAKDKKLLKSERYAMAYLQNEIWLNANEALFHRYNINQIYDNNEVGVSQ